MYQTLTVAESGAALKVAPTVSQKLIACGKIGMQQERIFYRKDDGSMVRCLGCKACRRTFSRAGYSV